MKKILLGLGLPLAGLGAYLGFAPVPIDPVVWESPKNAGFVGAFAPNTDLANLERISVGKSVGPEDAAVLNGLIYATSQTGDITRINPKSKTVEIVANTGGVPLGIEAHNEVLYIADAHKGLLSLTEDGTLKTLSNEVDGTPINYADDLDISKQVWFIFLMLPPSLGQQVMELPWKPRFWRLWKAAGRDGSWPMIRGRAKPASLPKGWSFQMGSPCILTGVSWSMKRAVTAQ